jgi:aldose sugar dehydrogenase
MTTTLNYNIIVVCTVFSFLFLFFLFLSNDNKAFAAPVLKDPSFKLDLVVNGLSRPTGMSFLAPNDFLVIEEDTGKVKRVINGQVTQTILDLPVSTTDSRGLLGIDSVVTGGGNTFVFLYFTESSTGSDGGNPIGNRLYRFELVNNHLVNPKLLLDLPSGPGSKDNGGPVLIGPDNNVYSVIGQVAGDNENGHQTQAQNFENGPDADGTSGIHRVTQDGDMVGSGILGSTRPLSTYYAYGIRNSFGMDIDPVTGILWDTENGPNFGDEINLVAPGFNSGWKDVMGLAPSGFNFNGLATFNGKGIYSDPEFVWKNTVAPTALLFFNSDKFGPEYKNDMFVGDYAYGRIYHFELNPQRDALLLNGPLADKQADSDSELQGVIFGEGFGVPTAMKIGPDGMLYVVSLRDGAVYRISRTIDGGGGGGSGGTCQKLPISNIAAIGDDGTNHPANAIDNNLNTRWSNLGVGSWIQADLGSQMTTCSIDIAWYNGNQRQNNFVISVSNDGSTFTPVFTGKSTGTTLSPERYNLPANTVGRFVRITVNGNTQNNWASITEIAVNGFAGTTPPPPPDTCQKLPISNVAAIGDDGTNHPANAIDNNLNTRWSNLGIGSWIQADMGSKSSICSVDIAWYRGNLRQNTFTISVSDDGTAFTNIFSGKSSGSTTSFEKYNMPIGIEARYVRITVNGNTENNWASITEIAVNGSHLTSSMAYSPNTLVGTSNYDASLPTPMNPEE